MKFQIKLPDRRRALTTIIVGRNPPMDICYLLQLMRNRSYILACLFILLLQSCVQRRREQPVVYKGKPVVPAVIAAEHAGLLNSISALSVMPDSTGRAAGKLLALVKNHFSEEEDYVLPVLGAIPLIDSGNTIDQPGRLSEMVAKYRRNKGHMMADHQLIALFTDEMVAAGTREGHPQVVGFRESILHHAAMEESVLFPAVELVGKYLHSE
ncbi:MAG TPA: hemerythrin domain-containing protein [Chitinophagaceae bacterium]